MSSEILAQKIRKHAIEMVHQSHASHIASILSVVDIIAVLYEEVLHIDSNKPDMPDRDRLILSKGHAGVALYAVLAEKGFFPIEELALYYTNGSVYSGHISHKGVPGVEFSTGSLGHGACVAAGMALAAKKNHASYHIYTIIGDGECNEGSIWEMALFAHQQKLGNLTVLVDHNKMQAMGYCSDILDLNNLSEKWQAFGWHVIDVSDGNDHNQLRQAFHDHSEFISDTPTCIIANTIKGKGVSFMENNLLWHYRDPQGDAFRSAIREVENANHAQSFY